MKGWTYVRTYCVRTIFSEPNFFGCVDYRIFLPFVLRCVRLALRARELRYNVIIKWSLWLPKGCNLLFSSRSRCQKANFCYQNKRRLGNNKTYSFKVAFCSYYQSVFHVLLLLTFWGITIITYFRDFGQTAFYRLSFSILSVKMKFCNPSVLNFKQSKIFKKFLDNPEQAKSTFKILTFKANWKKKNA